MMFKRVLKSMVMTFLLFAMLYLTEAIKGFMKLEFSKASVWPTHSAGAMMLRAGLLQRA